MLVFQQLFTLLKVCCSIEINVHHNTEHYNIQRMLHRVTLFTFMLCVRILSVVVLSVVAPLDKVCANSKNHQVGKASSLNKSSCFAPALGVFTIVKNKIWSHFVMLFKSY
jgi:hypothetical protein